ncbi:MAG: Taurine dioxygenase [Mycobacterium sp.]|nr:Taurine dioxygenase [Mycobacterium sp.]
MNELTITPLTSAIGAEVSGVVLAEALSPAMVAALRQALLEHLVLFFRDQPMDPTRQLRFAENFAPILLPLIDSGGTDNPGITVLDQIDPKGQYTERWHSDSTFLAEPPLGAVLQAKQLPSVGGDTCWASMYAAYDALSPAMQQFLEGLTAINSTEILDKVLADLPNVVRRDAPGSATAHPVVRVHPETGRKLLFVNGNFTTRIPELAETESRNVLDFLFRHINSPAVQVRFHWEPGSVAFWDNRATQHCAIADYTERRVMQRCMLQGDRPVGVATATR